MTKCPSNTAGCAGSRPCHNCRIEAIRRAHIIVRYDAKGRQRSGR